MGRVRQINAIYVQLTQHIHFYSVYLLVICKFKNETEKRLPKTAKKDVRRLNRNKKSMTSILNEIKKTEEKQLYREVDFAFEQ